MLRTLSHSRKFYIAASVLGLALLFSFGLVLSTGAQSIDDIEFPIEELGGCLSESDCHVYCNALDHISECIDFSLEHGLMTPEEAELARAVGVLDIGPGGCQSHEECEAYCENIANINECLAFAEEFDVLSPDELEDARRVADALASGAELPGGCTSEDSCERYCEDVAHIDECLAFAEAAGFLSPEELEEARRVAPFLKAGTTPGGCQSEDECEAYCEGPDNFEECIAFAVEAGFISPEEAELARRTGGVGPGGCHSENGCEEYCNNPDNIEECFAFAKEHGLISDEELAHLEEGIGRLQEGLENAPPETRACLEEQLGANVVLEIESGEFSPGPEIGEQLRECFERYIEVDDRLQGALQNAPPDVRLCFEDRLGGDVVARLEAGDPSDLREHGFDIGHEIEACFQEFGGFGDFDDGQHTAEFPGEFDEFVPGEDYEPGFDGGGGLVPGVPPEADGCLRDRLGGDYKDRLFRGEISPQTIESEARACIEASFGADSGGFEHEGEFIPGDGTEYFEYPEGGEFVPPEDYYQDGIYPEGYDGSDGFVPPEDFYQGDVPPEEHDGSGDFVPTEEFIPTDAAGEFDEPMEPHDAIQSLGRPGPFLANLANVLSLFFGLFGY